MAEPHVRTAGSNDVEAIVALHKAFHAMHVAMDAGRWTTHVVPATAYPAWIDSLTGDAGVAFVATVKDVVVGYLIAEIEPESPRHWSPASVYFHDLYVAPHARRAGVARRLVDALIAWQTATHPTLPIRLVTAADNEPARRFFASLGFRPAAVEMMR